MITKNREDAQRDVRAWLLALAAIGAPDHEQLGELERIARLNAVDENAGDLVECWFCGVWNTRQKWELMGRKCPFCRKINL